MSLTVQATAAARDLGHYRCRRSPLGAPGPPVQAAQLIDQNHAGDISDTLHCHLERIAFDPTGDGANEGQPGPVVKRRRSQDERRPPSGLLASGLW